MANCPKCNAHLKLVDWKQHCPHCGANIVIYDLQERLMQQADSAEVEHYHFQKKVDRVKGAFVGSKLAITRIITSLLPIGTLFLPLIKAKLIAPLPEMEGTANFLTVYNNISEIGSVLGLFGTADQMFAIGFVSFLLSVLLVFVHFALNSLACSPKGKPRNITIDILILITTILGAVAVALNKGTVANATLAVGTFVYIAAQILNVTIDFITLHKGIEIKHAQCYCGGIPIEEYFEMVEKGMTTAEIRAEQYKRLAALQEEKEAKLKADEEALEEKKHRKEGDS